jgi:hypothetical protein
VQTEYANHLKVLYPKGMVLNIQAKGFAKRNQVSVKKLNEIAECKFSGNHIQRLEGYITHALVRGTRNRFLFYKAVVNC